MQSRQEFLESCGQRHPNKDVATVYGFGAYQMGIAKDLTGNYRRSLLTMAVPMLIGAAIMFYLRRQSQRAPAPLIAAAAAP